MALALAKDDLLVGLAMEYTTPSLDSQAFRNMVIRKFRVNLRVKTRLLPVDCPPRNWAHVSWRANCIAATKWEVFMPALEQIVLIMLYRRHLPVIV